jgi:hypothetical protein
VPPVSSTVVAETKASNPRWTSNSDAINQIQHLAITEDFRGGWVSAHLQVLYHQREQQHILPRSNLFDPLDKHLNSLKTLTYMHILPTRRIAIGPGHTPMYEQKNQYRYELLPPHGWTLSLTRYYSYMMFPRHNKLKKASYRKLEWVNVDFIEENIKEKDRESRI